MKEQHCSPQTSKVNPSILDLRMQSSEWQDTVRRKKERKEERMKERKRKIASRQTGNCLEKQNKQRRIWVLSFDHSHADSSDLLVTHLVIGSSGRQGRLLSRPFGLLDWAMRTDRVIGEHDPKPFRSDVLPMFYHHSSDKSTWFSNRKSWVVFFLFGFFNNFVDLFYFTHLFLCGKFRVASDE